MTEKNENVPAFLAPLFENDPVLYEAVMKNMGEFIPEEGAIPKKYRILMSMVADGVLFHPEGVTSMAHLAREAGASQAEINEALRIIYLTGGMVALVNSLGAYQTGGQ